jgi:serine/threonine protein kinase
LKAPEVALHKPYNETCDVYSFCILLWQILKVETPFEGFTMKLLTKKVTIEGVRPKPDDKAWPVELCTMLRQGWHADFKQRPSMETISDTLRDVINKYSDEEINEIMDASRKSELSLRRGSGNSANLDSLRTYPAAAAAAPGAAKTKLPVRNENLDGSSSSGAFDF